MWQAPVETVELLLSRYPEGATVRNQYGSLPLHMAASNLVRQEQQLRLRKWLLQDCAAVALPE